MDLALRERQIVEKRRDLVSAAGNDPGDVCVSCGSDTVKTKRIVSGRMSFRRRYCPLCNDEGAELVEMECLGR